MEIGGRAAVITGGASGMGRAVAERLAQSGARVAILDRNTEQGEECARSIGPLARFFQADVSDELSVKNAIADASATLGDIHICCTFAGIAPLQKTLGRKGLLTMETFHAALAVNLAGTFDVARRCAERMAQNTPHDQDGARGVIIMIASIAAFQGPAGSTAYAASKAGVVGMTLPLARDLAPLGIRVNTIAPGLVFTPMTLGNDPSRREVAEARAQAAVNNVLFPRRFGAVHEVAHLTVCLIENDHINGECIRIDGGKRF